MGERIRLGAALGRAVESALLLTHTVAQNHPLNPPALITTAEAARRLGVSRDRVFSTGILHSQRSEGGRGGMSPPYPSFEPTCAGLPPRSGHAAGPGPPSFSISLPAPY
jgi:hypothetical protein